MAVLGNNFRKKRQYIHRILVPTMTIDSTAAYLTFNTKGLIPIMQLATGMFRIYPLGPQCSIDLGPIVYSNFSVDSANQVFYVSIRPNLNGSVTSMASFAATLSVAWIVELLIGSR